MSRAKSLVIRVDIDEAQRAHNCQANVQHRIKLGERRLKVRKGRSWEHYCVSCATAIVVRSIVRLEDVRKRLRLPILLENAD